MPKELSKELEVTTPRITVIIKELEKCGYVERTLSEDDRRNVNVTLTKKGEGRVKNTWKMQPYGCQK